jgi:hypothetical protein
LGLQAAEAPAAASVGTEPSVAVSASSNTKINHVKKRRLYRQTTGTKVVWFPHDNAPDLLKELLWESGLDATRWVIHGTPSSSAGVSGLLELGTSVVAICEDSHHKTHFLRFLREKCVELLLAGSPVFSDESLLSRANLLLGNKEKGRKKLNPKKM